jgi:hypothetical protein
MNHQEYNLYKSIAEYMRWVHKDVIYHFDLAGLNLSFAQAGMTKVIQYNRGWPDLFIAEKRQGYAGLFIEVKIETPYKKDGTIKASSNNHLQEQQDCIDALKQKGYLACFAWNFDMIKLIIDNYLNN